MTHHEAEEGDVYTLDRSVEPRRQALKQAGRATPTSTTNRCVKCPRKECEGHTEVPEPYDYIDI